MGSTTPYVLRGTVWGERVRAFRKVDQLFAYSAAGTEASVRTTAKVADDTPKFLVTIALNSLPERFRKALQIELIEDLEKVGVVRLYLRVKAREFVNSLPVGDIESTPCGVVQPGQTCLAGGSLKAEFDIIAMARPIVGFDRYRAVAVSGNVPSADLISEADWRRLFPSNGEFLIRSGKFSTADKRPILGRSGRGARISGISEAAFVAYIYDALITKDPVLTDGANLATLMSDVRGAESDGTKLFSDIYRAITSGLDQGDITPAHLILSDEMALALKQKASAAATSKRRLEFLNSLYPQKSENVAAHDIWACSFEPRRILEWADARENLPGPEEVIYLAPARSGFCRRDMFGPGAEGMIDRDLRAWTNWLEIQLVPERARFSYWKFALGLVVIGAIATLLLVTFGRQITPVFRRAGRDIRD